jgi:hypothetical protein
MTPQTRKLALFSHITFSVGWLGAVVPYLALAIAGLFSTDGQMVRAAYLSMELIGWYVIVPLSLVALLTGLVQSLGSPWGLFRHWWILVKFLLTTGAAIVLLQHMKAVSRMAELSSGMAVLGDDLRSLRIQLVVHAAGGLLVLLAATILSVFKPWGTTPYGRSKSPQRELPVVRSGRAQGAALASRTPMWMRVVGFHALGLAVLFVILHLAGGGMSHH